jgi:hypothetical protein
MKNSIKCWNIKQIISKKDNNKILSQRLNIELGKKYNLDDIVYSLIKIVNDFEAI